MHDRCVNALQIQVAAVLVAGVIGLSGCGGTDGEAGEVFSTTSASVTTSAPTGSTDTAAPVPSVPDEPGDASADGTKERWVGTDWSSAVGESSGTPVVDGAPISLHSVLGMCTNPECTFSLDLLTEADVDGAPPAGPYVIWASRFVDRTDDGRANWEVTDARDVELAEGETNYLCTLTSYPTFQVMGLAPIAPQDVGSITPASVWTVDDEGTLVSPDPSAYRCEVGGF